MFSQEFLNRYNRLVDSERIARRQHLSREIGKERAMSAKHGMNGHHLLLVAELHRAEINIRAGICWKAAVRILRDTSFGTDGDLRTDLKELVKESMASDYAELDEHLKKYLPQKNLGSGVEIKEKFDEVLFRHELEIDLYVDASAKNPHSPKGGSQYHFYGNVGAVQSGAYANATINMTIGAAERAQLLTAIESVESVLQAAEQAEVGNRSELLQVASECKEVLNAPEPNRTKLAAYLEILSASVQGIASAGAAYEALRAAIALVG